MNIPVQWEFNKWASMISEQKDVAPREACQVAIPEWAEDDGIAKMIGFELQQIGCNPVLFPFDNTIPRGVDYLLTFGPYNKILPLWETNARQASGRRPVVIHWNTEGMPDLRVPTPFVRLLGAVRSRIGRMSHSGSSFERFVHSTRAISKIDESFKRYRYHGDYDYAFRKGWLDILADSSHIYSQIRTRIGVPTIYAPWGASQRWYKDLGLERDIDVLWMGKRGTDRRGHILDRIFKELKLRGLNVYIGDNEVNPFIFGEERTAYLNRSKITLNVTRTWYDDNFSRFSMACPNRSLVVSEPLLPHCPEFKENVNYVSAKIHDLADTIVYYLEHEEERMRIVDNAYNLMMTELKFERSLRRMFAAAQQRTTTATIKS